MMQKEPALTVAVVVGFIGAVVTLLTAFNIDISEDQRNAIVGMVAPTFAFVVGVGAIVRQFVYAPKTVERIADAQYAAGVPPTEPQPEVPPPADVP